jgi:hypothetical protein
MGRNTHGQGMKLARLMMVLASVSPVFILWGLRGSKLLPDWLWIMACLALVIGPNLFLFWRIKTAKRLRETAELVVGEARDNREHLLVYLFAMLLPLYAIDLNDLRQFAAAFAALIFIVFLFWHLDLHYMNLLFAVFGYRVFTISSPDDGNPHSGRERQVLITKRTCLSTGDRVIAFRLSKTIFFEARCS